MKKYTCRQCGVWKVDAENKPLPEVVFKDERSALEHVVQFHGNRVVDTLLTIRGVAMDQLLELGLRDVNAGSKENPPPVIQLV